MNTPLETRKLASALLTYDDGTTLLLEVKLDQGIHRVNDYTHGSTRLITHEIFIAEAEVDNELVGQIQTS